MIFLEGTKYGVAILIFLFENDKQFINDFSNIYSETSGPSSNNNVFEFMLMFFCLVIYLATSKSCFDV
jgi:hypothetical protein